MAWYLNELLTDVDLLPRAVWRLKKYYSGTEFKRKSRAWRSFYRYLYNSEVNLSLIEERYWTWGEGNIFTYLAEDMALLLRNSGFIEASGPIQLTDLGDELNEKRLSMESTLASGLLHWQIGGAVRPVKVLLTVLERLDMPETVPCPGLMLPEFILVMRMLEQGKTAQECIDAILVWRQAALDGRLPPADASPEELIRARMRVCDDLAEKDRTIWDDQNRGRTTQTVIIGSGLAEYGGLFDKVQFMASSRSFLEYMRQQQPDTYKDVFDWLDSLSVVDRARVIEKWLQNDE